MDKLEEMQCSAVGQMEAGETEGKCLQNCGHTSYFVDKNERSRNTISSK